jgi:hypothetical protein
MRRPFRIGAPLVVALTTLHAREAHAEGDDRPRFALEADVGVGTPVGSLGVQGAVAPAQWLALQGGAGVNGRGQAQVSVMTQLRFVTVDESVRHGHLDLGLGVSAGALTWSAIDLEAGDHRPRHWSFAEWANLEVGGTHAWKVRPPVWMFVRVFLGVSALLNPRSGTCLDSMPCDDAPRWIPYFGVGAGCAL